MAPEEVIPENFEAILKQEAEEKEKERLRRKADEEMARRLQ